MRNNSSGINDEGSPEREKRGSMVSIDRNEERIQEDYRRGEGERKNFIKTQLNFLKEQMVFNFRKAKTKKYNMNKIIYKGLLFLLIEYLLYFVFQLISYFIIDKTWKDFGFIPGIVLGLLFILFALIIIILMNRKKKNVCLILVIKFFEFASYLLLTGYLTAHDFGFMSLSYIIIINILLIFIFVF